jgi:hypothetical protein
MKLPLVAPLGWAGVVFDDARIVVASHEVGCLQRLVAEVASGAFLAITPQQEVLGEGFAPQAGGEGA